MTAASSRHSPAATVPSASRPCRTLLRGGDALTPFHGSRNGGPRGWTDPPRVTRAGPGRGPLDPPLAPQHRPGELRARGSSYSCRPGQPRTASPRVPGGPGPRTWRMRDAGGRAEGPLLGSYSSVSACDEITSAHGVGPAWAGRAPGHPPVLGFHPPGRRRPRLQGPRHDCPFPTPRPRLTSPSLLPNARRGMEAPSLGRRRQERR